MTLCRPKARWDGGASTDEPEPEAGLYGTTDEKRGLRSRHSNVEYLSVATGSALIQRPQNDNGALKTLEPRDGLHCHDAVTVVFQPTKTSSFRERIVVNCTFEHGLGSAGTEKHGDLVRGNCFIDYHSGDEGDQSPRLLLGVSGNYRLN